MASMSSPATAVFVDGNTVLEGDRAELEDDNRVHRDSVHAPALYNLNLPDCAVDCATTFAIEPLMTCFSTVFALNPALVWFVRRRRPSFTASVDIGSECGRRFVVSVTEFERRCRCCWGWFLPPLWAGRGTTLPEKEG